MKRPFRGGIRTNRWSIGTHPGAAVLLLAAGVFVIWQSDNPVQGQAVSSGYEFDIVQVGYAEIERTGEPDLSRARIDYDLSWATEEFPGVRQCTWQVRDSSGRTVGSTHGQMQATQSDYDGFFTQFVSIRGEPASAEVRCGSGRVDNPDRELQPSKVELRRGSAVDGAAYSVGFDLTWTGTGKPSPQTCTTKVYDENGNLLFTDERGLDVDEGVRHVSLPVVGPREADEQADSATVACTTIGSQ